MKQLIQKVFGTLGYVIKKKSKLYGTAPGSDTRPIGELFLFLEDIRARGFSPRGIIDVGANRGEWTDIALSVFVQTPVIMIEPQDEMESFLTAQTRKSPNCHFVKAGASRTEGELVQTIWEDSLGSSFLPSINTEQLKTGKQRKTRIVTIDNMLARDFPKFMPDLVKLDIQGFELEALSGAETLFGKTEMFIVEVSLFRFLPGWPLVREIISFMADRKYELYDIPGRGRRPIDGALGQLDLAFVKADGMFRKVSDW